MSKPLGRHAASLPVKDGAPDKTVYDKFAAGSLRRRVWDAIVAAKLSGEKKSTFFPTFEMHM